MNLNGNFNLSMQFLREIYTWPTCFIGVQKRLILGHNRVLVDETKVRFSLGLE